MKIIVVKVCVLNNNNNSNNNNNYKTTKKNKYFSFSTTQIVGSPSSLVSLRKKASPHTKILGQSASPLKFL